MIPDNFASLNFKQKLPYVKAFVFDVDGVLSFVTMPLDEEGVPQRMVNVKDGYIINLANRLDYHVAIITGCNVEAVRKRFETLGVKPENIYLKSSDKIPPYEDFISRYGLKDEEVLFMGDDMPDVPIMKRVGVRACPADACPEIVRICEYVSQKEGGRGCVREVMEQVLRVQGKWGTSEGAVW